ncbi:hypothetical protein Rhopal_007286-T1 [Rhodotorula paludigena]|uniref:Rhodanese domain-containing protein n=1 Tax=Rhodotorula paludigena TaxID=86838 RepID=A0AAV5GXZ3_9BASI|nr:hypothetical protein Rhopal_007286-T1 [Rhodotorula paludigena]
MNYQYLNHDQLAALVREGKSGKDYQVVDVRVPKVIFHCSLSQVRGPKAARIYAEALAEAQAANNVPVPDSSASASSSTTAQSAADAARTFSPNPYVQQREEGKQQVFVLRDGFSNWQGLHVCLCGGTGIGRSVFGLITLGVEQKDPLLVENFDSRIWADYSP